jgi:hypothetical protein
MPSAWCKSCIPTPKGLTAGSARRGRLAAQLALCALAGLALVASAIAPALAATLAALAARDRAAAAAGFLRLAAANLVGWLTLFYGVFELGLGLAAEATGFGDRAFYAVRARRCLRNQAQPRQGPGPPELADRGRVPRCPARRTGSQHVLRWTRPRPCGCALHDVRAPALQASS